MRVRLLVDCDTGDRVRWPSGKIPAGTVLDEPDAFGLVRLGLAEPAGRLAQDALVEWQTEQEAIAAKRELARQEQDALAARRVAERQALADAQLEEALAAANQLGVTVAHAATDVEVEGVPTAGSGPSANEASEQS